jgi:hypothetical protein
MQPVRDIQLIQLAREIAIDHLDTDAILNLYSINADEWQAISHSRRFQELLAAEISAWQTAANTTERTRLKAGAIIEQWLPEANTKLHDPKETLNSKVELAKMLGRIAGLDKPEGMGVGTNGSGFSVTINLGSQPIQFDGLPSKVINHDETILQHNEAGYHVSTGN